MGYIGLAATLWVPCVLKYLCCNQMITQTLPTGNRRASEKIEFYCLRQVHIAKNLLQATHTQVAHTPKAYETHIKTAETTLSTPWMVMLCGHDVKKDKFRKLPFFSCPR